jgi:hypothetical protein
MSSVSNNTISPRDRRQDKLLIINQLWNQCFFTTNFCLFFLRPTTQIALKCSKATFCLATILAYLYLYFSKCQRTLKRESSLICV